MTPVISIIVAVYKAESCLRRCVDSLLAQTFQDYEILLVDDGSPDRSGEICDEYARKDNRVRVFHKENGGVASARQCGMNNARGEYVIHADPDDWVEPNMLEELYGKAKEENADVLICDTAGRLHNKKYLMDELEKIKRVIDKELPDASKEILLVLDATTGQNAILQVQAFKETVDITGLVLTKLDGTAKGGVVIGITNENHMPVKFIGVGEQIDDMEVFNSKDFVKAIIE